MTEQNAKGSVWVKGYPEGKIVYGLTGPGEYVEQAREALSSPGVRQVRPYVVDWLFTERMQERGVPQEVIDEFLASARYDDESCSVRLG